MGPFPSTELPYPTLIDEEMQLDMPGLADIYLNWPPIFNWKTCLVFNIYIYIWGLSFSERKGGGVNAGESEGWGSDWEEGRDRGRGDCEPDEKK